MSFVAAISIEAFVVGTTIRQCIIVGEAAHKHRRETWRRRRSDRWSQALLLRYAEACCFIRGATVAAWTGSIHCAILGGIVIIAATHENIGAHECYETLSVGKQNQQRGNVEEVPNGHIFAFEWSSEARMLVYYD